jgi:DNA (cytosine-5)-methyltransferase 1
MLDRGELIVDLFAGGGGASTAILQATGRHPDLAVDHDAKAVATHAANHPATRHERASVWRVEPREATGGRPVGLLWASPDCRHFSRASGGAVKWPKVRTLPGVVITWATRVRPLIIVVENVAEMQGWGPLLPDGQPCPDRVGRSFRTWCGRLRGLGYRVEWRELCAADFGAPTTRKRLFVVARCDGVPIAWPQPTHGRRPGMFEQPWRTAAECIDWSLPTPSIFDRPKPLADKTLARIAHGVRRFVQVEREGQAPRVPGFGKPLGTIAAQGEKHAVVAAFLLRYNGINIGQRVDEPLGTITTRDRFAMVTVRGVPRVITDIGMRMLHWRELAAAQGLPADYRWVGEDGAPLGKTAVVRLIGNSVSPPPAAALLRSLLGAGERARRAA